jgi:putative RNA 2'-phosphotransferase
MPGVDHRTIMASKFLAKILRHDPGAANLSLDRQGWARVEDVLAALRQRFGEFEAENLRDLVNTNDKSRYVLSDDGMSIRASQGHSIDVDLGLEPVQPPPILYHGTKAALLPLIMREGLSRGRRHHVHLSADPDTAFKVGSRRGGEVAVLGIRSGEMTGHDFYRSENGVWLTHDVPPGFIGTINPAARSAPDA